MPAVSLALADVEQLVSRPVIFGVVGQVLDLLRLSKDTKIRYAGKTGTLSNFGSTIDSDKNRNAKFASDRYTFIEVTEKPVLETINEHHIHDNEFAPFFNDSKIGLSLRPICINTEVNCQVTYRSNSRDEVHRWMVEFFVRKSRGREINLHRVEYNYSIPYPFMTVIEECYNLREATEGYGDSLAKYFREHTDGRLAISSNLGGENKFITVREIQKQIQGVFDIDGIPDEPQAAADGATWEITFGYKFTYQKPESCFLRFPVIVHNQLLPDRYLYSNNQVDAITPKDEYYSQSYQSLSFFSNDNLANMNRDPHPFISIPDFDDFLPENIPTGSATVFIGLCTVDGDLLLNLREIGDYVIDEDILNFMATEYRYMTSLYQSIFHIGLYINDELCNNNYLTIDADLNIRAKVPLNLREQHRIRFSVIADTKMLPRSILERLMRYPTVFTKVLGSINELLRTNPDFNLIGTQKDVKPYQFSRVWDVLTNRPMHNGLQGGSDPIEFRRAGFLNNIPYREIQRFYANKRNTQTVMLSEIIARNK